METRNKLSLFSFIILVLILIGSCELTKNEKPSIEGGDIVTGIWVSFDDVLYRIDDVRSPGHDYSTPYEMQVKQQIDLLGVATNGVRAGSQTITHTNANGEISEILANGSSTVLTQNNIGFVPIAPLLKTPQSYYAVGLDGQIAKLTEYFEIDWQKNLLDNPEIHSSPCIVHKVVQFNLRLEQSVMIASGDGAIRSLDPDDGSQNWIYNTGGAIYSNPAKYNSQLNPETYDIIFGSDDGFLYSVQEPDGSLVWQFETGSPVRSSPTVNYWTEPDLLVHFEDPLVYFGCDNGKVFAVDPTFGDLRWFIVTGGPVRSSPYFLTTGESFFDQEGLVIVGSDDGRVYCIESHTGLIKWTRHLDSGPIQSSPVALQNVSIRDDISRHTVYVSTTKGLFGLDAESGQIISQKLISSKEVSSPVALIKYDSSVEDGDSYWEGPWYPSNHSVFY